ncbi:MAG: hypothetical protein Q7R41_02635, partial [Phycisphaerales bacterium]|nr:hypothetical protein [Phycisphaerales bacterium]
EDGLIVRNMNCPPERLFRPDAAIVAWRKWCDKKARRSPAEVASVSIPVRKTGHLGQRRDAAEEADGPSRGPVAEDV